jgi:very-short-patch-repair endonuclease
MSDQEISSPFEIIRHTTDDGAEYWSARELMTVLDYTEWRNFAKVIEQARTACENSGYPVSDHFHGTTKMVRLGLGAMREVEDYMLSRYAFCLVLVYGDLRKPMHIQALLSLSLTALEAGEGVRPVEAFGISFPSDMPVTKEQQTIGGIVRAFAHLRTVRQYRVPPFVIDLYFPDQGIAVECDEYGHRGWSYDPESEARRQRHIEQVLGCTFVRYNPDAPNFHIGDVINEIILAVYGQPRHVRLTVEEGA